MRFPPALAPLLLLVAGLLPSAAHAWRPCQDKAGPLSVTCFADSDRLEWEALSQDRGSPGFLVNFDDFESDASFDNIPAGGTVDAGPMSLETLGPASCIPFQDNICGFNLVRVSPSASAFPTRSPCCSSACWRPSSPVASITSRSSSTWPQPASASPPS